MWVIIAAIVVVLGGGMGIAVAVTTPARNELKNMVIPSVDFKKLRDGIYTGRYVGTKDNFRNAAVEVTVTSGRVSKINVTEGALANGKQGSELRKGKSINNMFGDIISKQSLKVDVISGATLTSNAHLMAVENALEQASK